MRSTLPILSSELASAPTSNVIMKILLKLVSLPKARPGFMAMKEPAVIQSQKASSRTNPRICKGDLRASKIKYPAISDPPMTTP